MAMLALVFGLLAGAASTEVEIDPERAELSCDALLRYAFPDLCDLEVVPGTIQVRGLRLAYWRYSRRGEKPVPQKLPLLMVHGGPGFGHNYMLPLKQQACRGREVIFYDQMGAGASAQPDLHKAPWLLTVDYYVEELRTLVTALGWKQFHLVGSSWGTILSQAYAFTQDPRLRGVVLSGPLSDGDLYWHSQWDETDGNLGSLPFFVQATLWKLQTKKGLSSKLYAAEDEILTSFFTTRTTPVPDCFNAAKPTSNTSMEIYVGMQGASEFVFSGVLGGFNYTPRLPQIANPVLLTFGRYDTMRPPVVDALYRNLPRVWKAMMPRSGHCSMIDDPRLMNDVVGEFFEREEAGSLAHFRPEGEVRASANAKPVGPRPLFADAGMANLEGATALATALVAVAGPSFLAGFICHWGFCTRRRDVQSFPPLL
ncbi:pip [Symbiodinium natans]|uniref:Pip protein n=1 Tax=Symbiodinium natans TaxID=878477 RepID=A0A812LWZ3_9DINO|nr:pip [Symbiodinium natans]